MEEAAPEARPLQPDAQALLEAVVAISSDLDMHNVLRRIVESACTLTEAGYGALGVLGRDELVDFVTHGISEDSRATIGELPRGRGILRLLIDHPEPLRLHRLQDHPASFGFPPNHPPMTSFLGVPVRVRETVFGNLYLTEKAGGLDFTEQDVTLVEALASAAGLVIENTRAYALSEMRRTWLEASARLDESLQPPVGVDRALQHIAVGARSVSNAEAIGVLRRDLQGIYEVVASDGRSHDVLADLAESLVEHLRAVEESEVATSVPLSRDTNAVMVPLRARLTGPAVLLAVTQVSPWDLADEERELLTSFASQAGLGLDRIQAVAQHEELALVSDRDRIARDLHDLVIQRLFATGLHLQSARTQTTDAAVRDRIDQTVEDLDTTIRDIRSTIFELRHDRRHTLRGEITTLLEEYKPALGLEPVLRTTGPVELGVPERVADQLLAVLREAISNVVRHADAGEVVVEVDVTSSNVTLRVCDDGRGIPAQRVESGLENLRHRAEAIGGTIELSRREPRGTALVWRVPSRA